MRKLCSLLFVICLCSSVNADGITYVSQTRFTRLDFGSIYGNEFEQIDSVDFNEFNVDHSKTFTIDGPLGPASAFARARQQSTLGLYEISAFGTGEGETGPPAGSSGASGRSYINVMFSLEAPTQYSLELSVTDIEFGSVRFQGPGFDINQDVSFFNDLHVVQSGVAAAGDYELLIDISNGGITEGIVGTYQFNFAVQPIILGDANDDGVLSNLDITSFVLALTNAVAYQAMFPEVDPDLVLDMNQDGVFDNLDIAGFVAALVP